MTKALSYLRGASASLKGNYSKALAANALLAASPSDATALQLIANLRSSATTKNDVTSWHDGGQSLSWGYGMSMRIETTALVLNALLAAKDRSKLVEQGLRFLTKNKSSLGGYHTTQATVLALRALIESLRAIGGNSADGTISVSLNGQQQHQTTVDPKTSDVTRFFDLEQVVGYGDNKVGLSFTGQGELAYQVVGVYYLPHKKQQPTGLIDLAVSYDKTTLLVGEAISVKATARNTGKGTLPNVMMHIGLPPGFTVDLADFSSKKTAGVVKRAERQGPHVVLYLGDVATAQSVTFKMAATLAVKAKAPASTAYLYYTPEASVIAETPEVTVTEPL